MATKVKNIYYDSQAVTEDKKVRFNIPEKKVPYYPGASYGELNISSMLKNKSNRDIYILKLQEKIDKLEEKKAHRELIDNLIYN